jgi:hypothetical protein
MSIFTAIADRVARSSGVPATAAYYTGQAQLMAEGLTPILGRSAIGHFWRTAIGQAKAAEAQRTIQLYEWHSRRRVASFSGPSRLAPERHYLRIIIRGFQVWKGRASSGNMG